MAAALAHVLEQMLVRLQSGSLQRAMAALPPQIGKAQFVACLKQLGIRADSAAFDVAFSALSGSKPSLDPKAMVQKLQRQHAQVNSRGHGHASAIKPHTPKPEWKEGAWTTLSAGESRRLMDEAIWANGFPDPAAPNIQGQLLTRPVKRQVKVPIVEEIQVPVQKWATETVYEDQVVNQKVMRPVHRTKTVEETVVEVQEFQEKRTRMVWKLVPEEYYETVKKPVTVTKTREVPVTDYEEAVVPKTIQVPVQRKVLEQGYRIDQKLGSRMVEVERDEVYEVTPHFERFGHERVRYLPNQTEWHGTTRVGQEVYPIHPAPSTSSSSHRGANNARGGRGQAYIRGYATSKEAQAGLFAKLDKDGDGTISFGEYQQLMSNGRRPTTPPARRT